MNTIKKILIPIDFSVNSMRAVQYALGMTKRDKSIKFFLLHASAFTDIKKVTHHLHFIKREYFDPKSVDCECIIKKGEITNTVVNVFNENKIDLIIISSSPQQKNTDSSKTISFLKQADCPVLVLPATDLSFSLKNIVLALDEEDDIDSTSDLTILHDMARWYNANVHLLTVDKQNRKHNIALGKKEKTLEYYLDNLNYKHAVSTNPDIEKGIQDYIKSENIDMLAVMPKHHAINTEPSKGKLTMSLVSSSTVPLLVID